MQNSCPESSSSLIDGNILDGYKVGGSIYINTDAIENFVDNFLMLMPGPFTLVTGDSDTEINLEFLQRRKIQNLLNNKNLMQWYAQNLNTNKKFNEKIAYIPIGMDYHTMSKYPGLWGMKLQTAISQERALLDIFEKSDQFENRLFAGYCNWHFALGRGDRQECLNQIDKNICLIEKIPTSRISGWQRQSECMFVISPHGAGIDCHRTWEAILLGCVPVVKKTNFTAIFEELPVIIVDEWSDFNYTTIHEKASAMLNKKFNYNFLFMRYWENKINHKTINFKMLLTMKEYRSLFFSKSY